MSIPIIIKASIKQTWNVVKEVNEKIEKLLPVKNKNIIDSIIMTITELIENAVKYGEATSKCQGIELELKLDNNEITIKVTNGILNNINADLVITHIEKIKKSDDPAGLYTKRLMELIENPKPGISQLGLYRIAYEGKFDLDYSFKDTVFTITALRIV